MLAPVTFILAGERLVTLRYHEPRAFQTFASRAERLELGCTDGPSALIVAARGGGRPARRHPRGGRPRHRAAVARRCSGGAAGAEDAATDYQGVLRGIGRQGDLVAQRRRQPGDARAAVRVPRPPRRSPSRPSKDGKVRLKTLGRDTRFLSEHAGSLTQKLKFLLDATLGMISIEQNAIIKIFSVAAVVFLPPTLIASIYGMNFDVMPELHWVFGYPFALGLMVLSAVVLLVLQEPRLALT